jgi:hypothetical protein
MRLIGCRTLSFVTQHRRRIALTYISVRYNDALVAGGRHSKTVGEI